MSDVTLWTDDRDYIQAELTAMAHGVVETFTRGINAGRRLAEVRDRLPADQDFGAWCKAADFRRPDGKPFTRVWLFKLQCAAREYDTRAVLSDLTPAPPDVGLDKLARAWQDRKARDITPTTADQLTIGQHRIIPGDFRTADIPTGSVDLIVTDPPYPAESLPLWSDLARLAAQWLKPQGILVALTGKIQLPAVMASLGEHLHYGWMYAEDMPGSSTRILARHVAQTWKPWLAYSNGPWPSGRVDWHPDMLRSSGRDKDDYWWKQGHGAASTLIGVLSDPGDTVLDPFAGTGTYPAAAAALGRHVIACEADATRHAKVEAAVRAVA